MEKTKFIMYFTDEKKKNDKYLGVCKKGGDIQIC
jgi:hypothetical protein